MGVAVSDELWMIASPVETVDLKRDGVDALRDVVERYDPEFLVVGIPTSMSGREGQQARAVREFATSFGERIHLPVKFWDERLTSFMAEQALIESGHRRQQRKHRIDAVAAALILQSYLDSASR